jgi:hypothetical protein
MSAHGTAPQGRPSAQTLISVLTDRELRWGFNDYVTRHYSALEAGTMHYRHIVIHFDNAISSSTARKWMWGTFRALAQSIQDREALAHIRRAVERVLTEGTRIRDTKARAEAVTLAQEALASLQHPR